VVDEIDFQDCVGWVGPHDADITAKFSFLLAGSCRNFRANEEEEFPPQQ